MREKFIRWIEINFSSLNFGRISESEKFEFFDFEEFELDFDSFMKV